MSFVGFRCWYKPSLDDKHFNSAGVGMASKSTPRGSTFKNNKFNPPKNSKFNH